jgi:hypothetical protein
MLNLDVFLPRLLPSVTGCPVPLARQALIDSAIEFCEESGVVRGTTDPVTMIAGVATYDIDLPADLLTVQVLRAWYGTRELTPAPDSLITAVGAYIPDPNSGLGQEPIYFMASSPTEVTLYPAPGAGATDKLVLRVSTKPTRAAALVENLLYEDWAETLVAGALRRLHGTPDTPFFSDGAAARQNALFQFGIVRARAESLRGRVRSSLAVVGRAFA